MIRSLVSSSSGSCRSVGSSARVPLEIGRWSFPERTGGGLVGSAECLSQDPFCPAQASIVTPERGGLARSGGRNIVENYIVRYKGYIIDFTPFDAGNGTFGQLHKTRADMCISGACTARIAAVGLTPCQTGHGESPLGSMTGWIPTRHSPALTRFVRAGSGTVIFRRNNMVACTTV